VWSIRQIVRSPPASSTRLSRLSGQSMAPHLFQNHLVPSPHCCLRDRSRSAAFSLSGQRRSGCRSTPRSRRPVSEPAAGSGWDFSGLPWPTACPFPAD
jgi:hypothetical protein